MQSSEVSTRFYKCKRGSTNANGEENFFGVVGYKNAYIFEGIVLSQISWQMILEYKMTPVFSLDFEKVFENLYRYNIFTSSVYRNYWTKHWGTIVSK